MTDNAESCSNCMLRRWRKLENLSEALKIVKQREALRFGIGLLSGL